MKERFKYIIPIILNYIEGIIIFLGTFRLLRLNICRYF